MQRANTAALLLTLAACAHNPAQLAVDKAQLAAFEVTLTASDSATAGLESWCEAQQLAQPPIVTARRLPGPAEREPQNLRSQLGIPANEPVAYRHVALSCGPHVLSVAHNWYVPALLTADMNRALANGDTPFGKVVGPLAFRRETLEVLFDPPRECPRDTVSAHRARLILPDGRVLAFVVECYTPANLLRTANGE